VLQWLGTFVGMKPTSAVEMRFTFPLNRNGSPVKSFFGMFRNRTSRYRK